MIKNSNVIGCYIESIKFKKNIVKCLYCNGTSYTLHNENNNIRYIKMCRQCFGTGEIDWLDNLIKQKNEISEHSMNRFLLINNSDKDINIVSHLKVRKHSFTIYQTTIIEKILQCEGVKICDEAHFLSKSYDNLLIFEYIEYPSDNKYVEFLRDICLSKTSLMKVANELKIK